MNESILMPSEQAGKSSGICSHCFAKRKLHQSDGTVHRHGHRDDPCIGSGRPPLALSSATSSGDAVRVDKWAAAQLDATETQPPSQGTIAHPYVGYQLLKNIPRGARSACSQALTNILHSICSHSSYLDRCQVLLRFTPDVLAQPKRAGPAWPKTQFGKCSEETRGSPGSTHRATCEDCRCMRGLATEPQLNARMPSWLLSPPNWRMAIVAQLFASFCDQSPCHIKFGELQCLGW